MEVLEARLTPATAQFSAASETVAASAGTFSIPVTVTRTLTPVGSTFSGPFGLAFDGTGNLYVSNFNNGSVSKVTPGGTVATFASGFGEPTGLAFDGAGNLYVANYGGTTVSEVTPGGTVTTFASGFTNPVGLAFDGSGNLYVSNEGGTTVSEVTPGGMVTTFATGLSGPDALAFDGSGNLYVSNFSNGSVSKVTPAGGVSTFATGFSSPQALLFDGSGNLYVANRSSGTVNVVTPGGTKGSFVTGLNNPASLAYDSSGNLYIGQFPGSTVQTISTSAVTIPITLGGTAVSGTDYSGVPSSVVIPAGQNSANIVGTLISDAGPSQTLTFTLGTPTNATLGSPSVNTLTITEPKPTGTVSGVVFRDYNDNGVRDGNDAGLAGRTVFVDLKGDGNLDAGDPSTTTDASGAYTLDLSALPAGSYTVRVVQTSLDQPTGGAISVTTTSGALTGQDIGLRPTSAVLAVAASPDLFQNPDPNPSIAFAQSLYQALLGRDPGSDELAGNPALSTEAGRQQLANGFLRSDEYLKSVVDGFYQRYLGRGADPAGEANYVSLLRNGVDSRQVALMFITSAEYAARYPDATSFVQSLYQNVLGRSGSDGEVANYVGLLAGGKTRAEVARGFLYSEENAERTLDAFYAQFLQRGVDDSGKAAYTQQLENGADPSAVAAAILSSDEFYGRATHG